MASSSIFGTRIWSYLTEELHDFTCFPALDNLLLESLSWTVDKILSALYHVVVFVVFSSLRLVWHEVECIIRIGKVVRFFCGIYYQSPSNPTNPLPPEPVSFITIPRQSSFYSQYQPDWSVLHPLINSGSRNFMAPFDLDLAEFLLYMSSLTYESDEVVSQVISSWNHEKLDLKYSRFGHEGLIILILYSVKGQFLVPAFKGTSPFDLYEWCNNFSARKTASRNNLLPGLVHSGFYDMFGFPEKTLMEGTSRWNRYTNMASQPASPAYVRPTVPGLGRPQGNMPRVYNTAKKPNIEILVESFRRLRTQIATSDNTEIGPGWIIDFWSDIEKEFQKIATEFKNVKPSMMITGHSLGAGAASVIAAVMMWQRAGHLSEAMTIHWDSLFRLEGMITFGSPRLGDYSLCSTVDAIRKSQRLTPNDQPLFYAYRVINGLDIICSIPPQPLVDLKFQPPTVKNIRLERPSYLSVFDYHHFGDPVLLYHRFKNGSFSVEVAQLKREERNFFFDVWPNLLGFGVTLFQPFNRNRCEILLSLLKLAIFPSLIIDHAPAEYLANMGRMPA